MTSYFIEDKEGNLLFPSYRVGELAPTTLEKGSGRFVGEQGKRTLEDKVSDFSRYHREKHGFRVVGYKSVFVKEV